MKTTEICENLCRAKIESMGFELCDVEYQKEYGDWVLTFYIDKPEGVTIDECEAVSRAIEPILDEQDPIEQEYVLSVSSLVSSSMPLVRFLSTAMVMSGNFCFIW